MAAHECNCASVRRLTAPSRFLFLFSAATCLGACRSIFWKDACKQKSLRSTTSQSLLLVFLRAISCVCRVESDRSCFVSRPLALVFFSPLYGELSPWHLPSLSILNLAGLQLTGSLPPSWWDGMPMLSSIDMSLSRLQGPVPFTQEKRYFSIFALPGNQLNVSS